LQLDSTVEGMALAPTPMLDTIEHIAVASVMSFIQNKEVKKNI